MHSIYKELHPPTGVETAVVCNFFDSHEENLIVSTANELQVYKINHDVENLVDETDAGSETTSKLECLSTFKLFSKVISIQPIKVDNDRDYLLLSFLEAKLSLVQYDVETHDLTTVAVHNYEDECVKVGTMQDTGNMPIVRRDPDSRCAASLLHGNKLAVFPFFKKETGITVGHSYVVDLRQLDEKVTSVVDFQFLYGFSEPTIALLYEPLPTWSGMIEIQKDSVNMVAISLSLEQKANYKVWTVNGLPFDTFQLLPVPNPLGGLLAFATNSLMYVNSNWPSCAVYLNSIGRESTNFYMKNQEGVEVTLDCCQACFVNNDKVLISLKEGDLYVVTLMSVDARTVHGFHFDKADICGVPTTCICNMAGDFVFLGSRLGNSLLLKYCKNGNVKEPTTFEICDSILNIGPCGHMVIGRNATLSKEFMDLDNPDIELVTTSGFAKSGAISVLQRSIRPELVYSYKMPDCIDAWTVVNKGVSKHRSLLILSKLETTMIMEAGSELSELHQSGFITQAPTIFAGNMGDSQYIVQVSTQAVRLLEGVKCLQHMDLTHESPVVSCSLSDPYLALLTESREVIVILLQLFPDGSSAKLLFGKPPSLNGISSLNLYRDVSGLFRSRSVEVDDDSDVDEEILDDLNGPEEDMDDSPKISTPLLITCQSNGDLIIYSVPDFQVRFKSCDFISRHQVLYNDIVDEQETIKPSTTSTVRELLMTGLGNKNNRPHLMAIIDQELVIYEVYSCKTESHTSILQIRFKKVAHGLTARESENNLAMKRFMRPFDNISGLSGVFLCGACPHWIFMTYKGILMMHPMPIDGPITFLEAFHNVKCPNGFLYANSNCDIRMSLLPRNLTYDSYWPIRKISLQCTPYYVAYHPENNIYAVAMSSSEPLHKLIKLDEGSEVKMETDERDGFIYPMAERFHLQFYCSVSWKPIPDCNIEFDELERITSAQVLILNFENGLKGYVVCGTTYSYPEDIPSRGRIAIIDTTAPNNLKINYNLEQKAGVSAVASVQGFLLAAVGQKINMWQMKDGELKVATFIDSQTHVQSIVVIKNIIYVGDVFQSVSIYKFHDTINVMTLVSRDMDYREIYSLEFMVSNQSLHFMASDSDKQLLFFSYEPQIKESFGGQKLIKNANFNIGSHVNSMCRVKCKQGVNEYGDPFKNSQTTYLSTLDGGIGCVAPIPEKMHRRLLMLQTVLTVNTPHVALLNPKESRYSDCAPKQMLILDGVLISKFYELSHAEMEEVCKRIGTNLKQILSDLGNIEMCTSHF